MPRSKNQDKMSLISVHVPKKMLEELDELVRRGIFPNRSEAIRAALRDLLYKEVFKTKPPKEEKKEEDLPISLLKGR
ncbi:ribbon-helix-helix domain-containing protein [Pyrobaculum arsenaticum]|uniref:Putative transcriptional regulator, CopG family n=1 Tax=Pyrobaculum arsenaticum (strain DSM 13514 / JCM 11321 / PZ6) TaxID=340102 RepID=A4WHY4_PYRAR|nr:ribbon-helix-helix domain-containing protein [Pyrobaculum arsenaticum]ABP50001.1 putative transcriptional regulator, CopG family [Pyrobaculum arsenaticum DSM 13514]